MDAIIEAITPESSWKDKILAKISTISGHDRISKERKRVSEKRRRLAKVPDSKKAITKEPSIEQGLLKVKTQARSKTGFGERLFFGLIALGIVSALKRNSNQEILPEPKSLGYQSSFE